MNGLRQAVSEAVKSVRSEGARDSAISEATNGDPQRALAFAVVYLADTLRR